MSDDRAVLLTSIAAALGGLWRFDSRETDSYRFSIFNPGENLKLLCRYGTYSAEKGRLVITATELKRTRYIKNIKISVNPSRSATAISRDIKRRLLPKYKNAFSSSQERGDKGDEGNVPFILNLVRTLTQGFRSGWRGSHHHSFEGGEINTSYGEDNIRLELFGLTGDEVIRVLGALKIEL